MFTDTVAISNKPAAEVDLNEQIVSRLLREQHPDLADLALEEMSAGWDNQMFRLGTELAVRLPRRSVAVDPARIEHRWLREIEGLVPIRVPVPVRIGIPNEAYPYPWSIVPWIDGDVLGPEPLEDEGRLANDLGGFFAALHTRAPADAPQNPFRGIPLIMRDEKFRKCLSDLGSSVDQRHVESLWERAIDVEDYAGPAVWVHGDVHPLNLIVDNQRRLTAVIDFGDLNGGDPATDLAIGWTAFEEHDRVIFRAKCRVDGNPVDEPTWSRGWGWALNFAVIYLANSADVPVLHEIGENALRRVLADVALA
jgi:aminoglycoside phosphotransferase (APT) family kinase protein